MARPRTITDERLLAAAGTTIAREGPGFTLAQVAAEAGVAVGSVSRRFGSKHGLLRALSRAAAREAAAGLSAALDSARDPRLAVRDGLADRYAPLADPAVAANHLGQLGADISDPALRDLLGEYYAALEAVLAGFLRRTAGRRWRGPEPEVAARLLLAAANGAAIDWSVRPRGELVTRLREDIDAITEGWWT